MIREPTQPRAKGGTPPGPMPTLESVLAQCVEFADCLLWQGYLHGRYPCMPSPFRGVMVRRWIWQQTHDRTSSSSTYVVRATCGERLCCNPAHLKLCTRTQLAVDTNRARVQHMEYPQRLAARTRLGLNKLDIEKARAIRADDRPMPDIAKHYNVSRKMVYKIKRGISWREGVHGSSVFTFRP
jgi:hypothetical protein